MIIINATGDTTLHTAGKYCAEDILVKAPAGSGNSGNDSGNDVYTIDVTTQYYRNNANVYDPCIRNIAYTFLMDNGNLNYIPLSHFDRGVQYSNTIQTKQIHCVKNSNVIISTPDNYIVNIDGNIQLLTKSDDYTVLGIRGLGSITVINEIDTSDDETEPDIDW